MSETFLTKEEVAELTGLKAKRRQVEQLRKMGLPFWLNAAGTLGQRLKGGAEPWHRKNRHRHGCRLVCESILVSGVDYERNVLDQR